MKKNNIEDNKLKASTAETNYELDEHDDFVERIRENSIRKRIIILEGTAIALNLACFITSTYWAVENFSSTALAVSLDNFLDIIAHSIVLWRYHRPQSLNSPRRDIRASICLALIFFISSLLIEFESIRNLVLRLKPKPSYLLIVVCLAQSIAFDALSIYTCMLACRIKKNSTLISSGINSIMSGLANLALAVSMTLLVFYPRIWYFDNIFGLLSGIVVFIYACQLFVNNTCFVEE